MKKSIGLTVLILLAVEMQTSFANIFSPTEENEKTSVSGKVTDDTNTPIPYANVVAYNSADSSLVTGTATDTDGKFSIPLQGGNYYLIISFLSYKEKMIPNLQVSSSIHLGKIVLQYSTQLLEEVEVIAEKSQMELKLDKRVFTVGKDLGNTGSNAAEILDNVPSVTVSAEGNVSLRGSENVRILIDGKPSGLVGISSTDALRQLQGNMIERIEIITNPSARYDAEGEVGIINIVLRKEKREGVNGSFEATTGYPENYRGSFNINFRKKSINLFTNYGINYRESPGRGYSLQKYNGDTTYTYESNRTYTRTGISHNLQLGSSIFFNDFNTFTFSGLYTTSNGLNNTEIIYKDYDSNTDLMQTTTRTEDEDEQSQNIETTLNYLKTFKQKGREWTTEFKWMRSDDFEKDVFFEHNDQDNIPLYQRSSNTEDEENILFQSDYVYPFSKNEKMEAGWKSNFRTISNDFKVEEKASDNTWFPLTDFDNHFVYNENIHAGYVIAGNKTKKLSYQFGLRVEYADITTKLLKTNEINSRNYTGLFPSTHLSYELDSSNTLQLSYSRRISRPRVWFLLPFFSFSDSRSFFSGNANLEPEYTNSFELGNLKQLKKGSFLISLYYRYRTGVIEHITTVDSTGFTRIFPINLSTQNAYGLEMNANYDIARWWRINGNFNFYRAITDGEYNGRNYNSDTYTWTAQASSKLTFYKKVNFQPSFNYRAPKKTTQGKTLAMYSLDLGLSSDVLKGKGTLTLSVKDALNTRMRRSIISGENFYTESEFQWRARQLLFSFNYRLNQKKQRERNAQREGNFDSDDMGF